MRCVLIAQVLSAKGTRRTREYALGLASIERSTTARVMDSQGIYGHLFVQYGNIHMSMHREGMLSSARISQDMLHGKDPFFLTEEGLVWHADGKPL